MDFIWLLCVDESTPIKRRKPQWEVHIVALSGKYQNQQFRSFLSFFGNHMTDDSQRYWDFRGYSKKVARVMLNELTASGKVQDRKSMKVTKHRSLSEFYKHIGFEEKRKRFLR